MKINKVIKKIRETNSGVTLLELMVAVALFAITIILTASIFQSIVVSQRDALASQELQENIRYAFEKIDKEVRTAQRDFTHTCIPDRIYWVKSDGTQLQFINEHNQCVCYYLNAGKLMESSGGCVTGSPVNPLPLTPQKLTLSNLYFQKVDNGVKKQAMITLGVHIDDIGNGAQKESLDMETTISSRFYE
ncbi:MAG TPA: prepilin-type N-terminal cleavage/methylation domain-containing protein [Candidatus Methylomirabilis sp.]|nr:prepilin-type N-terminal cleavage/methylation domain-containing protein [Candidatus Methylomirabilis sp.]